MASSVALNKIVVPSNHDTDKVVFVSGAPSNICNGRYAFVVRREGKVFDKASGNLVQTDVFKNDTGVILERNVDFDNLNWKLWHPKHHNGYSFYWVKAKLSGDYDIPPKMQWIKHKGKGNTQNLTVEYCKLLN